MSEDCINETSRAVIAEALTWIGTPYRHQGSRKGVCCDCLGLVRGIWRAIYGTEPDDPGAYTSDWAETGGEDRLLEAARRHCIERPIDRGVGRIEAGSLLVFRWRCHHAAKHLGIMLEGDAFLHAFEGHQVMASPLIPQWRRRIAGVFAFPPLPPS
jgi:NlpC/P60 family putative phage cell wall peptidase